MRLADYLTKKKISQSELARRLGIKQSTISKWVLGKRRPGWVVLARVEKLTRGRVTARDFMPGQSE